MATFPAIRCSSITSLPGAFPARRHSSIAGNVKRLQRMNRATGAEIRMAFRGISDAELATLRAHWDGEQRLGSWLLSAEILDVLPHASEWSAMKWRYKGRPSVVDRYADCHDVELELEAAPATPWIDTVLLIARPASVAVGAAVRLIGPDTLPAIWVSRLTTAGNITSGNYKAEGSIALDSAGNSYQAFWFTEASQTDARVVVVKRSSGGVILRQWWTAFTVGAPNAGIGSLPPAVLPMAGGGCVVAAKINDAINTNLTRVWRLNDDGTQAWAKEYTVTIGGPMQLWHAADADEIIIGTSANYSGAIKSAALVRINAANGNYIAGRLYYIDSTETELRSIYLLPSGSILLNARRTDFSIADGKRFYLLQASDDLATVEQVYGLGTAIADGAIRGEGNIVRTAGGDLLVSTQGLSGAAGGLLRLSSAYSVVAHYKYNRTGGGGLARQEPISLAVDDSGAAWMLGDGSAEYAAEGATLLALTDNGAGLDYLTDLEVEQTTTAEQALGSKALQIDPDRRRVVLSTFASISGYVATAQGYAMEQTSPATTLDIGNSRDVKGLTTDPAPGTVAAAPTVTRYSVSASSASISGTAATGSVSMVDAGASLAWTLHRVYV